MQTVLCSASSCLASLLFAQNNYPETLGKTVIINAPTGKALRGEAGPSGMPALPSVTPP